MVKRITRRQFLRLSAGATAGAVLAACGSEPAAPTVPTAPAATGATAPAAGGAIAPTAGGATAPTAGGATAPTAAPAAASGESGTLTVWGFEGTYEGIESQVDAFTKQFPNVKVDIKKFGYDDTHTNLLNAIVAGTGAPDLVGIDVLRLTQYVDGLTDLSEQAKPYFDQFVPPIVSLGSYKGKFYGLATDSEPVGVFYRKDLWDQYSVQEEKIETWADLANASGQVHDASQGKVSLYAMNANDFNLFEVLAVEQGFPGYYFNKDDTQVIVDDPKMVEAVNALKPLWGAKGVLQNVNGGAYGDEMTAALKSGKVTAQIIGAAWYPSTLTQNMPELSGKWRLMRVPAVKKGGPRIGYQYPTVWVIPQQSTLKSSAWELAHMSLIGDGARRLYEKTKILPAYKPLLDELETKSDDYFGGQKVVELSRAIAKDTPDVFFGTGFTEAQEIMGNYLQEILNGQKSAEDGLRAAAQEMREKLKKG
jgi:lactose/L-arabinose transport system substrate-binding protein